MCETAHAWGKAHTHCCSCCTIGPGSLACTLLPQPRWSSSTPQPTRTSNPIPSLRSAPAPPSASCAYCTAPYCTAPQARGGFKWVDPDVPPPANQLLVASTAEEMQALGGSLVAGVREAVVISLNVEVGEGVGGCGVCAGVSLWCACTCVAVELQGQNPSTHQPEAVLIWMAPKAHRAPPPHTHTPLLPLPPPTLLSPPSAPLGRRGRAGRAVPLVPRARGHGRLMWCALRTCSSSWARVCGAEEGWGGMDRGCAPRGDRAGCSEGGGRAGCPAEGGH